MVTEAFKALRPSKLILDRTGDKLFNDMFGIYSEVGPVINNFLRNEDEDYLNEEDLH